MSLLKRISSNTIVRNLTLAFCAIVVFAGVTALILNVFTRHSQRQTVPDFIGLHVGDVRRVAREQGLRIEILDSMYAPLYGGGAVIEQIPVGGTEVKRGRRVLLTITSHQQKMVPVPYVTGFSLRQAKNMIEMAGLEISELRYTPNIAAGNVLAQLVGRDTLRKQSNLELEVGSGVTLVVGQSDGASWVSLPKVVGLSMSEAKSRLWERGFNIGEITRDEGINLINQKDASVWSQSPPYGRQAALGTRVSIKLTLDEDKISNGTSVADREARRAIANQEAEAQVDSL